MVWRLDKRYWIYRCLPCYLKRFSPFSPFLDYNPKIIVVRALWLSIESSHFSHEQNQSGIGICITTVVL